MFIRIMESAKSLEDLAFKFCASWDTYLFISRKIVILFYQFLFVNQLFFSVFNRSFAKDNRFGLERVYGIGLEHV